MNQKIPFYELAKKISETNSITEESAEVFLKNFFDLIGDSIIAGETVKINGIGSFSVKKDSNGDNAVVFVMDKEISDAINAPFLSFEPVELNDDVTDEMLSNVGASEVDIEPTPECVAESVIEKTSKPATSELEEAPMTVESIDESIEIANTIQPLVEVRMGNEAVEEMRKKESVEESMDEVKPITKVESIVTVTDGLESATTTVESSSVITPADMKPGIDESEPEISSTLSKSAILDEEPEEYVEHVQEENGSNNGGFGWGFLVGLLVGLALGACAVYLAIDYIFPYGRLSESGELSESTFLIDIDDESPALQESSTTVLTDSTEKGTKPVAEDTPTQTTEKTEASATNPVPATVTDTIRSGYLIVQMAKKHYGSKDFWAYIYEENKSKIGNPNKMNPGTVLVIPPKEKYGIDASNPESLKKAKSKVGEILSKFK